MYNPPPVPPEPMSFPVDGQVVAAWIQSLRVFKREPDSDRLAEGLGKANARLARPYKARFVLCIDGGGQNLGASRQPLGGFRRQRPALASRKIEAVIELHVAPQLALAQRV